ncbi:hypothetical protein BAUCODRAFT_84209 [Baudoinia panamericana UAMH 10762]|uniref:Autophagy-related protein 2 n=1 Tax=Baudoinia panamericana (strain UAMH 10762) TaxID=717646 RepID=M2MPC5_BAUPA|nr:uncharacterized protein BAUCODRAFT_84209 [Baudoinia panamericana UAMH 10762]EMC98576.1 hypothetical protein BAUCODRAFT_84209 [Baudoinia panamericana UAMH 10762]
MSWWQNKIIPFALRRLDIFEDAALDPSNFDASFGRKSAVELRNVGLKVDRICKLLQLPPALRVETAKVLSLRLSLGLDFYQAALQADVEGVVINVRLVNESEDVEGGEVSSKSRTRSPEHRKTHRRRKSGSAKSFLLDEPPQERQKLEASLAASKHRLEESVSSGSSEGADVGIGAPVGLPGFLAGYLQRCIDGLQIRVKNIELRFETDVTGNVLCTTPVTLRLRIGSASLEDLTHAGPKNGRHGKRHVDIQDVTMDLLSDAYVAAQLSKAPSRASSRPQSDVASQGSAHSRHSSDVAAPFSDHRELPLVHPTPALSSEIAGLLIGTTAPVATDEILDESMRDSRTGSRVYSHREAESLYMSAMTHEPSIRIPGGWGSEGTSSERSVSPDVPQTTGGSYSDGEEAPGNVTPRAGTPRNEEASQTHDNMTAKRLLDVNQLSLWFSVQHDSVIKPPNQAVTAFNIAVSVPGAFSGHADSTTYDPLAMSEHRVGGDPQAASANVPGPLDSSEDFEIEGGSAFGTLDLSSCRLLYAIASATNQALRRPDLHLGRLQAWLSGSELLAFDRQSTLGTSTLLTDATPDVAVRYDGSKTTMHQRPVVEVHLDTLPLRFTLDLAALDDTLSTFGGLSGVLELSSSLLAESTMPASPKKGKPSKGVHFASDPPAANTGCEIKLNTRISGADMTVRGTASAVNVRTTTLKAIHREAGAKATVEHIIVSGPYDGSTINPPITVDIVSTKVEYLLSPHDKDLERLLSLLTPSKDKYDSDNDIIVDALMRQRRKGALIRASVNSVKAKISEYDCMHDLRALGEELSKLSAVAKYLPEDERPGILTLVRLQDVEAQIPISNRFGSLNIKAQDLHCANVGLPFLLALAVGDLAVSRGSEALIHSLVPLAGGDSSIPMLMARMLGNEAEPTVKVKLFNVCVEYSVPILVALVNPAAVSTEEVVTDLAQSVTDFAFERENSANSSPLSQAPAPSVKKTNIDLLVHDSALGFTPEKLPSKVLFVLTDAKLTTLVPPETTTSASLALRKAAIFVTDSRDNGAAESGAPARGVLGNTTTSIRLSVALAKRRYVSVGSIMSAKVSVTATDMEDGKSKAVGVEVSNELFLLESCADSTQTLFATLGALAPPTPPSKQPKYLTQPMTIEDMMASFTGDAYTKPEAAPAEMLFDVEDDAGVNASHVDFDALGDALGMDTEPDNLLAESEMTSSLYEPLSGLLGDEEQAGADRPNITQKLPFRIRLRDTHIIWNIHDGYDWQRTREGITQAVEQVEARAEERMARRRHAQEPEDEESVIGDLLFNSIYVGVPAYHDAQELRRQINRGIDDMASETESLPVSGQSRPTAYSASGRPLHPPRRRLKLERSKAHKVAFELKGVAADVLVFPHDSVDVLQAVDLRVQDFEIFDNVPTSTWRKFLTSLEDGSGGREMAKPMAHIQVHNVKTLQDYSATELVIQVTVLPLRLHVDQDALDFTARFFEFKDEQQSAAGESGEQPFIQRLEVDTVDLQLDYKPKRLDYGGLRSGHTTELMNLITLDAANIRLKHAIVYGIRGFEPIHKTLNDIWMPDIRRNQLPTVLAGLAPVRSLVNIGSGVRDVVAIPIREYRKDGRIVRSIQKGALQFGKTTTSELARLGAKLAIGTQNVLQGAENLLSPATASPTGRPGVGRRVSSDQGWHDLDEEGENHEQRAISAYANQPLNVFSGLRSARRHLERDLLTARDAFIAVQGEIMESNNPGAAAAALVRHAPTVILRPVIGASRAVGTTLLGVGNQIDRQNVRRAEDVSPQAHVVAC